MVLGLTPGSTLPGARFFREEDGKLAPPVRTAIAPKMEGERVRITRERSKVGNKETHSSGGNKELESSIRKLGDSKQRSVTANSGLEDDSNRTRIKTKFASPDGHHKSKERGIRVMTANREAKKSGHFIPDVLPRSKGKSRQDGRRHDETGRGSSCKLTDCGERRSAQPGEHQRCPMVQTMLSVAAWRRAATGSSTRAPVRAGARKAAGRAVRGSVKLAPGDREKPLIF